VLWSCFELDLRLIIDDFAGGGIIIHLIESTGHRASNSSIAYKQVGTVGADYKVEISAGVANVNLTGVGIYSHFAGSSIAIVVGHSFLRIVLHDSPANASYVVIWWWWVGHVFLLVC